MGWLCPLLSRQEKQFLTLKKSNYNVGIPSTKEFYSRSLSCFYSTGTEVTPNARPAYGESSEMKSTSTVQVCVP